MYIQESKLVNHNIVSLPVNIEDTDKRFTLLSDGKTRIDVLHNPVEQHRVDVLGQGVTSVTSLVRNIT